MKIKFFHKIYSLVLVFSILSAIAINSHWHKHDICKSETNSHFHQIEKNCTDLQINIELFNFYFPFKISSLIKNYYKKSYFTITKKYAFFSFKKSSRAPPFYII